MAVRFLQDIYVSGQSTMAGQLLMDNAQIIIDVDAPGAALTWRESDSATVAGQLRAYVNRGDLYLYNEGVKTAEITANVGSFVPDLTITTDLVVSGGDITLGGTGRIQGIDTVTDGTDAVNKNYVDNAITVDGSGAANYVTYWSDADTVTGDANLYWDSGNKKLGIGTSAPGTELEVVGATTTNNIIYNTPTGTSAEYRGELVDFGGFEVTVSAGDLVVLRHTLGLPQWYKADYNSSVNATGMLGIYNGTDVLVRGYVQNSSFSFTTSGVPLYMGASGAISTAAPTGNGDFVRIIGYVADAANDRIYICPDNTWVEITA